MRNMHFEGERDDAFISNEARLNSSRPVRSIELVASKVKFPRSLRRIDNSLRQEKESCVPQGAET